MLYTLEQVGVVGAEGDGKPAAAPVIAGQVGKVDRLMMLHCPPHVLELFILVVGTIADPKRPLRKCLASSATQAERIILAAFGIRPRRGDVTPPYSRSARARANEPVQRDVGPDERVGRLWFAFDQLSKATLR